MKLWWASRFCFTFIRFYFPQDPWLCLQSLSATWFFHSVTTAWIWRLRDKTERYSYWRNEWQMLKEEDGVFSFSIRALSLASNSSLHTTNGSYSSPSLLQKQWPHWKQNFIWEKSKRSNHSVFRGSWNPSEASVPRSPKLDYLYCQGIRPVLPSLLVKFYAGVSKIVWLCPCAIFDLQFQLTHFSCILWCHTGKNEINKSGSFFSRQHFLIWTW